MKKQYKVDYNKLVIKLDTSSYLRAFCYNCKLNYSQLDYYLENNQL